MDTGDVAAAVGDDPGDLLELSGLVDQLDQQAGGPSGIQQAPIHHTGQAGHIDVAAGDHGHHTLSGQMKLIEHHRSHGYGSRTLGDHLLLLHQRQDGAGDFVIADQCDLVDIFAHQLEGVVAGPLDCDAVSDGGDGGQAFGLAAVDSVVHTGCACRLNAVDLHRRADLLDGVGDAGDQSAAADGDHDGVDVVQVIQDLQGDGALACDDVFIVEGMNEGVAFAFFQLQRLFICVVVAALHQAHICAIALGGLHLGDGSGIRQADERFDAILRRCQRHALGVVSCGAGDDAPGLLLVGEHCDLVGRATNLEGAGDLQIFRLQVQLAFRRNAVGPYKIGLPDDLFQDHLRIKHLVQR